MQQVPVGEELDRRGRDLGGPPAIREHARRPPPGEQQHDQSRRERDEPAATARHVRPARPAPRASRRLRCGRRPAIADPMASNRSTRIGWVFDARSSPHPSGNVIRTPSMVFTGYRAAKCATARSTSSNFRSSGTSTRISGVAVVAGRSAQQSEPARTAVGSRSRAVAPRRTARRRIRGSRRRRTCGRSSRPRGAPAPPSSWP